MTDWKVSNVTTNSDKGYQVLSLRRYDGTTEGAHRVVCGPYTLLVLPDGATSTRARHAAIMRAIVESPAYRSDRQMIWNVVEELQAIGAHRWQETESGSVPAGVNTVVPMKGQSSKLLNMLVSSSGPVPGYVLAKRIGHRFSARVYELRQLGYPIGKKRLSDGQYAYFLRNLSTIDG